MLGAVRGGRRRRTRRRCSPTTCPSWRSRPARPSAGTATPTHVVAHRPLRRVAARRTRCSQAFGFTAEHVADEAEDLLDALGDGRRRRARRHDRGPSDDHCTACHDEQGQSPWLDNLKRTYLHRRRRWPSSWPRACGGSPRTRRSSRRPSPARPTTTSSSPTAVRPRVGRATPTGTLVIQDIQGACDVLRPVYDACGGGDGYVSIEVAPSLAHDTEGTTAAARRPARAGRPPQRDGQDPGTAEGLPAIRAMIAEGHQRQRHPHLRPAPLRRGDRGLPGRPRRASWPPAATPAQVHSVASFFVSRVDTEIDRRLEAIGTPEAPRAARARRPSPRPSSPTRWPPSASAGAAGSALAAAGRQRSSGRCGRRPRPRTRPTPTCSTSTASSAPAPSTRCPTPTLEAFLDHGTVARTVDARPRRRRRRRGRRSRSVGVDVDDVGRTLEDEGVASFAKSFDELLQALQRQGQRLRQERSARATRSRP